MLRDSARLTMLRWLVAALTTAALLVVAAGSSTSSPALGRPTYGYDGSAASRPDGDGSPGRGLYQQVCDRDEAPPGSPCGYDDRSRHTRSSARLDGYRLAPRMGGGSEVLLDTSAVKAQSAARSLMKPGECAVICSTVEREAAQQGFSTAGLPVVADGTSAVLRSQVAAQLRGFGAAARGLENDAIIGATALERGIPLITGDRALWNAVLKLGGEARWFAPGV